jgi:hypothetical protein
VLQHQKTARQIAAEFLSELVPGLRHHQIRNRSGLVLLLQTIHQRPTSNGNSAVIYSAGEKKRFPQAGSAQNSNDPYYSPNLTLIAEDYSLRTRLQ